MNCHVDDRTSHWEKRDNPLALRPGGNVIFIYTPTMTFITLPLLSGTNQRNFLTVVCSSVYS